MAGAGSDPAIGAVVITGSGAFFSSGGNVNSLLNSAKGTLAGARSNTDKLNAMIMSIVECSKPVIAAVEGGAAGAGFALALACDMIVASEKANFTAAYVRVGLSPDGGTTYFLWTALPRQLVLEICMLGQPVPATRLAAAGLVNRLAAEGGALKAALELGCTLAEGPPEAIANIKRLVNTAPRNDLPTHLQVEARAINLARFGAEAKEGLSAFLEKRRPRYHGNG
jgi:enoyl-CoA hydratase/carnithine racemase